MRLKYLRLGVLIVSIIGLVSCSSDENNQNSDETPPTTLNPNGKVEIENSDTSYQHIAKTKQLRVESHINLELENDENLDEILTQVSCHTNKRQEKLTYETVSKYQNRIPVTDILPLKVFIPSSEEPQILCDLQIEVLEKGSPMVKIQLKEVLLIGAKKYSNLQLNFLRGKDRPYLKKSDLVERGGVPQFNGGQAHLLCEYGDFKIFDLAGDISWDDLIDSSAFISKNIQLCRIALDPKNETNRKISDLFFLQNKEGKLFVDNRAHLISGRKINWQGQTLASLSIENRGDFASFFKLSGLDKGRLSLTPVYYHAGQTQFFSAPNIPVNVSWEAENLKLVKKGKTLKQNVYKLEAGEAAHLELVADEEWTCPQDLSNGFGACGSRPIFAGYMYRYSKLPEISVSEFSDFTNSKWKTIEVKLKGAKSSARGFYVFAKDQKSVNSCSMIQRLSQPREHMPAFQAQSNPLTCR